MKLTESPVKLRDTSNLSQCAKESEYYVIGIVTTEYLT